MASKEYPLRSKGRKFQLCTCSHGSDSHNGFWRKSECQKCECPKYETNPDTQGDYVVCDKDEADVSSAVAWTGCVRYYKKVVT